MFSFTAENKLFETMIIDSRDHQNRKQGISECNEEIIEIFRR